MAYKAMRREPFCPQCDTVLAKSEISGYYNVIIQDDPSARCRRCGAVVAWKDAEQWFFRITSYRDRLIAGLNTVDYPEGTKEQQRHWLENLVDWCVSRQRKWGCPIPLEGETDTLDTFVDSSFYYVRYCDPTNTEQLCAPEKYRQVDLCVGGPEHACAHLIYARFIHYFLYDIGAVPMEEPFKRVVHQGMITSEGHKMSKSLGNVVNPDVYDPDELRMQLMFIGPYTEGGAWNDAAIVGVRRFLQRMNAWLSTEGYDHVPINELRRKLDLRIRSLRFNTAVSDWMGFYNEHKGKRLQREYIDELRAMLTCFAPNQTKKKP